MDADKVRESTRGYYASISSIDRNIGRLLEWLDDEELSSNTLVLFTSDHGYNEGRHSINTKGNGHWIAGGVQGPKRPNMWDTSIRVPLAMRWPSGIRPGTLIDYPVSNIDMYRTILGVLGVAVPAGSKARGIDFSPLLRQEPLPPREALYGQYDLHNNGLAYLRMVRTNKYKYVRHFHAKMIDELYDLGQDPGETRNLLRGRRRESLPDGLVREFEVRLETWMKSIDDPLLTDAY